MSRSFFAKFSGAAPYQSARETWLRSRVDTQATPHSARSPFFREMLLRDVSRNFFVAKVFSYTVVLNLHKSSVLKKSHFHQTCQILEKRGPPKHLATWFLCLCVYAYFRATGNEADSERYQRLQCYERSK